MNIVQVKVNLAIQDELAQAEDTTTIVPVVVPELDRVRALAQLLHTRGQPFRDTLWGWAVQYEPEINEAAAEYQIPTAEGGYRVETRPFWSPASFTIGESGLWFFSLLWENGPDQPPVEFLDQQNVVAESPYKEDLDLSFLTP
ncbi:MAG: hypothetical protein U0175_07920 [Caldilineaceae bacterium]